MSKITLNDVADITQSTTAQATINANSATIETAFENTLSRDGSSPNSMSSSLDMNSNQIFNLPAPTSSNSPVRLVDVDNLIAGGTVNAMPSGGTTGQALTKNSNTNYDTGWSNIVSSVGLSMPADFTVTGTPITSSGTLTSTYVTPPTGTGAFVKATSPTLVTPVLGAATATTLNKWNLSTPTTGITIGASDNATITLQGTDTYVGRATTDTLTNKTLTSPAITTPTITGAIGGSYSLSGLSSLTLNGSSSGSTVVQSAATASGTVTVPATTDTLVGKATTDILTNKTYDTAGTGNVFKINGTSITANTGTGSNVLATSPTLTTPVISSIVNTGTLTLPTSTDTLVGKATTDTLTNKTLTSPVMTTPTLGAATATSITFSPTTGGIVGTATNNDASAGFVGEYIESVISSGSAVSLTSNTQTNLTSISLTAGDWDVDMSVVFTGGATTTVTVLGMSISSSSATIDQSNGRSNVQFYNNGTIFNQAFGAICLGVPNLRRSLSGTTTIFAVVDAVFAVSTCSVYGILRARRVR